VQISRLFQITYILLENGTTTAGELAKRFEVSARTIYRDIDALCQAGIPIYTVQGKGGGIMLMDRFVLNKSVLSEKEQNEILIALQSLSASRYPERDEIFSKMSALFKKSNLNWIEVDFSSWGSDEKQRKAFSVLKTAVIESRALTFSYFSAAGKSERRVEPVKLLFKDKSWYLDGFCLERMAYRTFKISRMTNIEITDESCVHLEPRDSRLVSTADPPERDWINLNLKISHEGAYRVYDDFDEKNIVKHDDQSFTVTTSMPTGEWIYSYLLSFGTVLEVIEPLDVRNEMARRLKIMSEKYLL
jgi:predicted DNA-binding transcriptional regulator YafY